MNMLSRSRSSFDQRAKDFDTRFSTALETALERGGQRLANQTRLAESRSGLQDVTAARIGLLAPGEYALQQQDVAFGGSTQNLGDLFGGFMQGSMNNVASMDAQIGVEGDLQRQLTDLLRQLSRGRYGPGMR